MKKLQRIFLAFLSCIASYLLLAPQALAHEQYVLTKQQLDLDLADKSTHVLAALNSSENIMISTCVGIGIITLLVIFFFFQYSKLGLKLNKRLNEAEPIGHILLRVSLGASLIASAYFHSFLGPEIPVTSLFLGNLLIPLLYTCGILLVLGLFTRIASLIGFVLLLLTTYVYGEYMITYFNYFGEFLALILFGSYVFSLDNKFLGKSKLIKKYKNWEILLIRVTYGISVMYPAITLKLLHPAVIVEIVNEYHLNQIWWLFPHDPLLISLGTGLAQILVGIMIIIGFETRLASFATFLLYVGSIIFFKEAVWPHYVLLSLAFYLVLNNGGTITLDNYIGRILGAGKKK